MNSGFYHRNSKRIIVAVAVSLALVWNTADTIPPNNNTESWISSENIDRKTYEEFRHHFGGEELILVALERDKHSARFVESFCSRLESLDEIRKVWSPDRLSGLMSKLGVPESEHEKRLRGISISTDGELIGVAAILTPAGLTDRTATMRRVNEVLKYCDLSESQVRMTGAPVIVAELDRLGGKEANRQYFTLTIVICFGILWFLLKQVAPAGLILLEVIWAFQVTLAIVNVCGGEMNFILDSLPVMVMVFTMAIAIHYIYHAANFVDQPDAVAKTLRSIFWPCFLAMFTTAIGLLSLCNSEIPPVKQFGVATAGGTVIAFIAGLFITPAVLQLYPPVRLRQSNLGWQRFFELLSGFLDRRRGTVIAAVVGLIAFCGVGLAGFRAEFQPLKFFPSESKVLTDTNELRTRMANTDSVEVIVDFGALNLAAGKQIDLVREIEAELLKCDRVPVVVSGVTWLPSIVTPSNLSALNKFKNNPAASEFVADGGCMWRLSARINPDDEHTQLEIFTAITKRMEEVGAAKKLSIRTTGIAPLIVRAQSDIFWGFWSSVGSAAVFITLIMMATLKSIRLGGLAMIPNVAPLILVFGTLGWLGIPTDIGTMMTGSITLGIAVDGSFHFLSRYTRSMKESGKNSESTLSALVETGPPIVQATVVTGVGMLALTFSNFGPTGNFGLMMSVSLGVALIGDLILLPCLLLVFGRDKKTAAQIQADAEAVALVDAQNEAEVARIWDALQSLGLVAHSDEADDDEIVDPDFGTLRPYCVRHSKDTRESEGCIEDEVEEAINDIDQILDEWRSESNANQNAQNLSINESVEGDESTIELTQPLTIDIGDDRRDDVGPPHFVEGHATDKTTPIKAWRRQSK